MYDCTLYNNKTCHKLHDLLLSLLVNFSAHSDSAKYVLCFNEQLSKQRPIATNDTFINRIVREAFAAQTRMNSYQLCFDMLDGMMLNVDGINTLINNRSIPENHNLLAKCVNIIQMSKSRKMRYKHRKICCIKIIRNLAMVTLGHTILVKYFCFVIYCIFCMFICFIFLVPTKIHDVIEWLDIEDEQFLHLCCELFRNLGFILKFKLLFCNHRTLIKKMFRLLVDDTQECKFWKMIKNTDVIEFADEMKENENEASFKINDCSPIIKLQRIEHGFEHFLGRGRIADENIIELNKYSLEIRNYFDLILQTKLSLITFLWTLMNRQQKTIVFIRSLGCSSLQPIIQRIEILKKKIQWKNELSFVSIFV